MTAASSASAASSSRPRVLVVGQGPPTAGGIPTFVTQLVADEALAARVHLDYFNTTPATTKKPGKLSLSNVALLATHAREVFRRARRADVVHLNLAPAPLLPLLRAIVLAAAARAARSAVILHAHTGRLHIAARSRAYRAALRVALRVVDELVVVSRLAEDAVKRLGGSVTHLVNGIDPAAVPTGPKDHDTVTLSFVGTICERKGLIDLRDALLQLKEKRGDLQGLRPVFIGDAKQEGPGVFERIKARYSEVGLDEVEFTGALEPEEVRALLGTTGIFSLPSHWEGFPLSLLEAMAGGAAVIATEVGDIPDMLDHGRAGILVPVKDVAALRDALARLVDDPAERERLGAAARERVTSTYTQEAVVRALADLYERLSSRRR